MSKSAGLNAWFSFVWFAYADPCTSGGPSRQLNPIIRKEAIVVAAVL